MMLNYFKYTIIFATTYWGDTEHAGDKQVFPAVSEEEKPNVENYHCSSKSCNNFTFTDK